MSRHRNVRSMDYSEEYEGFDDVYGHSLEDDYCISPSDAAPFMYDRTRLPQMSAFFNEEDDIAEEDETSLENSEAGVKRQRPLLNDLDEARLLSCLEEIRNVIGDSIPERVLVKTVLKNDFNINKSLDDILNSASSASEKKSNELPKPQREGKTDRDDNSIASSCSFTSSIPQLGEDIQKLKLSDVTFIPMSNVSSPSKSTVLMHDILTKNLNHLNPLNTSLACSADCSNSEKKIFDGGASGFSFSQSPPTFEANLSLQSVCKKLTEQSCIKSNTTAYKIEHSSVSLVQNAPSKVKENEGTIIKDSLVMLSIPKLNFGKYRKDSDKENSVLEGGEFSSLSALAKHHQSNPVQVEYSVETGLCSSLAELASQHLKDKTPLDKHHQSNPVQIGSSSDTGLCSSLAELASHHLKDKSPLGLLRPSPKKLSPCMGSTKVLQPGFASLPTEPTSLADLAASRFKLSSVINDHESERNFRHDTSKGPSFFNPSSIFQKERNNVEVTESVDNEMDMCDKNGDVEEGEGDDNWVIDLTAALTAPKEVGSQGVIPLSHEHDLPESIYLGFDELVDEKMNEPAELACIIDPQTILKIKSPYIQKQSSAFGKIICKKWKQILTPYIKFEKPSSSSVKQFNFKTSSPDDFIEKNLRRK